MQEQIEARRPAGMKGKSSLFVSSNMFIIFLMIIGSTSLLYSGYVFSRGLQGSPARPIESKTVATNGTARWAGDSTITAPRFDFPMPGSSQALSVSPLFAQYYSRHSGASSLGGPLTVAFPIRQGWIQFFAWGALLLPATQQVYAADAPLVDLIDTGVRDPSSGIKRLALLQALLAVGSQARIGGNGSTFTYVELRKATSPALLLPAPAADHTPAASSSSSQGVFIPGGTSAGKTVGHLVPAVVWHYITRTDVSPQGWKTDFGAPLTEALAFTVMKAGSVHHLLVQAFWRDGVLLDQDRLDAAGKPQIQRLDSGIAYLRTAGPPKVTLNPHQGTWAQGNTTLLEGPGTGQAVAHVRQQFPLTLLGQASWKAGQLWYHVHWTAAKQTGAGWAAASAITFRSPGNVAGWASFDVLSPALAAYLASIGSNVNTVVYDVTRQRYYTYHDTVQFIMGSSMKVPIMLTFLDMTEREGREPDDDDMNLLTTMIENSNNDSASELYYRRIGSAAGVASYLQRIGITGLDPNPSAWGYSLVTPLAMVNLLTLLHEGKILTAHDRDLALYLMEHIELDQRVGTGDTAPPGATVAMKNGWLPGPDGLWAMNTSGIVMVGQETYIISVYTHEQPSLNNGHAIVRHVCGAVASLLT
jgi:beta-lactamase class A